MSERRPKANKPGFIWAGQPPSKKDTVPPSLAGVYKGVPIGIGGMPNGAYAEDPSDSPPAKTGDVEIWEIYNISPDVHPMHLHLVNFKVLKREPIKVDATNSIVFDKAHRPTPTKVDPNENLGWKDTVRANPGEKITLLVNFGGPNAQKYAGDFVWHCHIIDHEDMGMMRPLEVQK